MTTNDENLAITVLHLLFMTWLVSRKHWKITNRILDRWAGVHVAEK